MEVPFTPEQEARLAQIAGKAGTEPALLVKNAALHLLEGDMYARPAAVELPVWRLGVLDSMHRRDLYKDVR
jgi:hypothetical protein